PIHANWHFGSNRNWYLNFGPTLGVLLDSKYEVDGESYDADLDSSCIALAEQLSRKVSIAYIYTETFGGRGYQYAFAWRVGKIDLIPTHNGWFDKLPPPDSPINQVLRRIGVQCDDEYDEYDSVGLSKHRSMDEWFEEGTGFSAEQYTPYEE
ncbi:MAG: hypothetical protein ACPG7F_16575, partial [Aggregatilineales bacterium]